MDDDLRDLAGDLILVCGDLGPGGGEDAEEPVTFCAGRDGGDAIEASRCAFVRAELDRHVRVGS